MKTAIDWKLHNRVDPAGAPLGGICEGDFLAYCHECRQPFAHDHKFEAMRGGVLCDDCKDES